MMFAEHVSQFAHPWKHVAEAKNVSEKAWAN